MASFSSVTVLCTTYSSTFVHTKLYPRILQILPNASFLTPVRRTFDPWFWTRGLALISHVSTTLRQRGDLKQQRFQHLSRRNVSGEQAVCKLWRRLWLRCICAQDALCVFGLQIQGCRHVWWGVCVGGRVSVKNTWYAMFHARRTRLEVPVPVNTYPPAHVQHFRYLSPFAVLPIIIAIRPNKPDNYTIQVYASSSPPIRPY
jgi:hypothetical protein